MTSKDLKWDYSSDNAREFLTFFNTIISTGKTEDIGILICSFISRMLQTQSSFLYLSHSFLKSPLLSHLGFQDDLEAL